MAKPFDLAGQAFKRDPGPTFVAMRAVGAYVPHRVPIIGQVHFATTYEAVNGLLKDPDRFSVDARAAGYKRVMGAKWWMPKSIRLLAENMLTVDGDAHRRLRKMVDHVFFKRNIDSYRPVVEAAADRLLDDLAVSKDGDLVAHFARALPLFVICDLLGLPQSDRPSFVRWMGGLTSSDLISLFLRIIPSASRLTRYLKKQFEWRRREPGDDLISALVNPEDQADALTDDELLSLCFLLFVAGHETTTHLISGGVLELLRNPDELSRLKSDWSLADRATDELLRHVSPVQMTKPRFVLEDITLAGRTYQRGAYLMALLASANRDPDAFDNPERIDIGRRPNRHVAFGNGPHICLGLHLARVEMQVALEKLFQRYPDTRLAVPEADLRWTRRMGLRALTRLPLALRPGMAF